jgi:transposase
MKRKHKPPPQPARQVVEMRPLPPLPNYSLSSVCPACNAPTVRRACKVRCERCGFTWDCSEL